MSPKDSVVSAAGWVNGVSGWEVTGSAMKGYSPRRGIGMTRIPSRTHHRHSLISMPHPLRIVFRLHDLAVAHVDDAVTVLRGLGIVGDHQHGLAEFLIRAA